MKTLLSRAVVAFSLGLLLVGQASADLISGPTPYLSSADIPLNFFLGSPIALEDFEDGTLDFGITASAGSVQVPAFMTDSVDGDDGIIDGFGTSGHSWFSPLGFNGVTFTFAGPVLPTAAGIVWTDGAGATTFEAFDEMGLSLGTIGPVVIADAFNTGETAEDRFFGVHHASGISAIKLRNTVGGIEVDHVQFGHTGSSVPEPSLFGLSAFILAGLFVFRQRRRDKIMGS